ncbi:MAG: hypothetical protein HZA50_02160 [Planctomycetes bacterium]|nr:hypothetical protein [Planctomycetota bacterium]
MKILWMMGSAIEGRYDARIAQKMKEKYGYEYELFTYVGQTAETLREAGIACTTIKELLDRTDFSGMSDRDAIDRANELLKCLDIKMLLHGDYLLMQAPDGRKRLLYAARVVIAMAGYMSAGGFDCCMRYGGGGVVSRAMCYLADAMGIKSFDLMQGTWYGTSDLAHNNRANERWIWISFAPFWEKVKDQTVPDDEKRRIDEYVSDYYASHTKKTKPPILTALERPPRNIFSPAYLTGKAREFIRVLRPSPKPPVLDPLAEGNMDKFSEEWARQHEVWENSWLKSCRNFRYDPLPRKYVYMPLVFKWDISYMVWNYFNYMQEFLTRVAAESLPAGCELVVKEHPYYIGIVSHDELRGLQKAGIKVADPRIDSLDLVRGAQTVVSLGETSGWEALMSKVPVVVIGSPPFYAIHPAVRNVTDFNCMPDALRLAVKSKDSAYSDAETWYRVMKAALFSTTPANIWAYKNTKFWADQDESDKNVEQIADMIVRVGKLAE